MDANDTFIPPNLSLSLFQYKLCAILYLVLVILSIIPYAFVTGVILGTKSFRSKPFYKFVLNLALADQYLLVFELFYCIPLAWQGTHSTILFLEYVAGIPALVMPINVIWIALNRYVAVCWYKKYDQIFGGKILPTANYESSAYLVQWCI